jgi:hypothetical protein
MVQDKIRSPMVVTGNSTLVCYSFGITGYSRNCRNQ